MLFFFGTGASKIASHHLSNYICSECDTKGTTTVDTYSKYAHVFWIPMFPYSTEKISCCSHCKLVLHPHEMDSSLINSFKNLNPTIRKPWWHFIGLMMVAVLIAILIVLVRNNNENDRLYIQSPKMGDIIKYQVDRNSYSTMRVADVSSDSVYVNFNEFVTDRYSGTNDINKEENYSNEEYSISRNDLMKMYEEDEINSVDRE